MGCISLASFSCSLKAKIETLMTARSARREGMKMSDISVPRLNRYSSQRTKSGWRQVRRFSDNVVARRIGMTSISLEEITAL